jgi:hypothetical protein
MSSTYWRDRVRMAPAIPVGADGGPPSDEEVAAWRTIHEQAEKESERERERELQAEATAEKLHGLVEVARREEQLAWMLTLKEDSEREIAKHQASTVESAKTIDVVEPAAPDPKNKGGRPSLETERLKLMRSLLATGDERKARTAYIETLTTPGTDWAGNMGLVTPKHAGDSWHDLRPKLARRALKRRRKRNN